MIRKLLKNRIGIVIGVSIASLLVFYYMYLSRTQYKRDFFSVIEFSMSLGIIFGGTISGFIVEHYFVHRLTKLGSIIGCILGSITISPLSVYCGIIFGGLSGMAFLGFLMGFMDVRNIKDIVVFLAMLSCITLVVIIVESIGATLGSAVGSLFDRIINVVHRATSHNKDER